MVKKVERWLLQADSVLGEYIIKQARAQARGDRVLYEDLLQESILCVIEEYAHMLRGGELCVKGK